MLCAEHIHLVRQQVNAKVQVRTTKISQRLIVERYNLSPQQYVVCLESNPQVSDFTR